MTTTGSLIEHVAAARAAAERAMDILAGAEPVEKTFWSSPAGKKRIAKRLVAMLPPHKTYVEPFCGSAAVLFEKDAAPVEVINDFDEEIAGAYRMIRALTPEKLSKLRKKPWVGDKATFKKLFASKPTDEVERLHKFLYVTHFSYGHMRKASFSPAAQGVAAKTVERLEKHSPRLAKVKIFHGDYERVVRKYDSKDTVFFLDPPYAGYNAAVGESQFDEHRFLKLLKSLKGKFLLTYGIRGELPKMLDEAGFTVKRIRTPRTIRAMRGVGGSSVLTQIVASNYEPTSKAMGFADGCIIEPWHPDNQRALSLQTKLLKAEEDGEERFVLGEVLVPEDVDAQKDIYSAAEVRKAAHVWMEEYGGLGLQHSVRVDDRVKVLETYVAPADFELDGEKVKKGSWLMAVRILDDAIWNDVKAKRLTGFSIGGSARRERAAT
jgi:DNA adenine methylase